MAAPQQEAVAVLVALAQESGIAHEVNGSRVGLRIADGAAATGITGVTAVRAKVTVSLRGDGRYTVGVQEGDAHGGFGPSGLGGSASWSTNTGTVRSKRIEKGIGPNGAYDLGFDSGPWVAAIDQRLAALGWSRLSGGAVAAAVFCFVAGGLLLGGALALGIVGAVQGSGLLLGCWPFRWCSGSSGSCSGS